MTLDKLLKKEGLTENNRHKQQLETIMEGFEININKRIVHVGVNAGTTIIVMHHDKIGMRITGSDDTLGKLLDWGMFELNVGDTISITASQVKDNTLDPKSENMDRKNLISQYHEFKKYLTEQGLIPRKG